MAKPKTVVELSVWENPPSCKGILAFTLLILFICGSILAGIGVSILNEPDKPIKGLLKIGHEKKDVPACRQLNLDLCKTVDHVTSVEMRIDGGQKYLDILKYIIGCGITDMVIAVIHAGLIVKRAKRGMFLLCLLIPIPVTMKWKVVDLCVYHKSPTHNELKDSTITMFAAYTLKLNQADPITGLFNTVSIAMNCCGVRSFEDAAFRDNKTVDIPAGGTNTYHYPPVCCKSGNVKTLATSVTSEGCKHAKGQNVEETKLKTEGCYEKVFDYVYDSIGKWLVALSIVTIFVQSLQMMFAVFFLLSRSKEQQIQASRASLSSSGVSEKNSAYKKESRTTELVSGSALHDDNSKSDSTLNREMLEVPSMTINSSAIHRFVDIHQTESFID